MAIDKKHYTGGNTEGGITSSYATDDGVKLKVPYSFMGSIYDDAEYEAAIAAMHQDHPPKSCDASRESRRESPAGRHP